MNGTISSLGYDAKLVISDGDGTIIWNNTVSLEDTTHASGIYDPEVSGELNIGSYTAELFWPNTCHNNSAIDCLGFATIDFSIVGPVYGCRDDGTLPISNDPMGCCNSSKSSILSNKRVISDKIEL